MLIQRIANDPLKIEVESLRAAKLDRLDWQRVILNGYDLTDTSFRYTNLRGADLSSANLSGSDLTGSYLMVAVLEKVNLKGAILRNAKLNGADLISADLSGANLSEADVWKADFSGANLSNANMSCLRINEATFEGALYDKNTIWPEGFNPEEIGAILTVQENNVTTIEIRQEDNSITIKTRQEDNVITITMRQEDILKILKRNGNLSSLKLPNNFKKAKLELNDSRILEFEDTSKLFKEMYKIFNNEKIQ
ncbi:pentapeptide repeat-containing protein [Bacillus toyonensis]|uniref:pentapeptide repeat-containing protein n=1 Tax=Bacillus toyonensis TaxID=155322 RepID=UPI0036E0E39C